MRKVPPVGTRLRWAEVAATLRDHPAVEAQLAETLGRLLGGERAFLFGSGRAALAATLTALRCCRAGDRVIVPAYTCWSVPAAIVRAGLRVLPVEMKPGEIDYDFERLARMDWDGVLAVISPNLFGLPGDLSQLEGLAEDRGVPVIDDAAQCFGGSLDDRLVGSFGIAGILSFGRGKNITALGGGAVVVRDEPLAASLNELVGEFVTEPAPGGLAMAMKGLTMRLALSPALFGTAEKLPGVRVGVTTYEPAFPLPAFGAARAALALRILPRLVEINQRRANLAARIDRAIKSLRGIVLPRPRSGATPAWLRRPVLTIEDGKRDALLKAIQQAGIGATAMYPAPVHRIEALAGELDLRGAPFDGAERLAANLIAVPLVEGMLNADIERLAATITEVMGKRIGEKWV